MKNTLSCQYIRGSSAEGFFEKAIGDLKQKGKYNQKVIELALANKSHFFSDFADNKYNSCRMYIYTPGNGYDEEFFMGANPDSENKFQRMAFCYTLCLSKTDISWGSFLTFIPITLVIDAIKGYKFFLGNICNLKSPFSNPNSIIIEETSLTTNNQYNTYWKNLADDRALIYPIAGRKETTPSTICQDVFDVTTPPAQLINGFKCLLGLKEYYDLGATVANYGRDVIGKLLKDKVDEYKKTLPTIPVSTNTLKALSAITDSWKAGNIGKDCFKPLRDAGVDLKKTVFTVVGNNVGSLAIRLILPDKKGVMDLPFGKYLTATSTIYDTAKDSKSLYVFYATIPQLVAANFNEGAFITCSLSSTRYRIKYYFPEIKSGANEIWKEMKQLLISQGYAINGSLGFVTADIYVPMLVDLIARDIKKRLDFSSTDFSTKFCEKILTQWAYGAYDKTCLVEFTLKKNAKLLTGGNIIKDLTDKHKVDLAVEGGKNRGTKAREGVLKGTRKNGFGLFG